MKEINVSSANGACRIELNRPDCGNLVSTDMVQGLTHALQSIAEDVKLVVIAGRGGDFCKGRDYQTAPESAAGGKAPSALRCQTCISRRARARRIVASSLLA